MATYRQHPHLADRLRIIFEDTDMTFPLAADATYADIAAALETAAPRHHGHPVTIEVRLAV
jgi:hypothetical protein